MTGDVRKLLGGYATGTLTEAEQKQLYEAALQDDVLFAALADEQALRDLLADPASKQHLLGKLKRKKQPPWSVPVAIAAMLVITVGAGTLWLRMNPPKTEVAMSVPPPAVSEPARPEAERPQPRQFKPEERKTATASQPIVQPPPAAIAVRSQAPKMTAPPAAAEIKQEPGQLAAPRAVAKAAEAAAKIQYRFIDSPQGLRVALTSEEGGQLMVTSREGNTTRLIFNAVATPQTEYLVPSKGTLPGSVTELLVTLDKTVFASRMMSPQSVPSAARSAIRAEADQAVGSPYTLRISIPKKD